MNRPDNALFRHGCTRAVTEASLPGESPFLLPDFRAIAYFLDGRSGFRY